MAAADSGVTPSPPPFQRYSRRRFVQLGFGAGAGLLLPAALAACRPGDGPLLLAAKGAMPGPWLEALPGPWRQQFAQGTEAVVEALNPARPALVSLPDGWASQLPLQQLQSFGAAGVLARLAAAAQPVSRLFQPEGQPALAFPWAFSPWVLVFRSQPALAARARGAAGWRVLEEPALKGRLVLPSSPRVVIEICGGNLTRLQAVRGHALAYDEADALNLLLTGEAVAAVVPLQGVIPLLRRDQRLEVVLPSSGAPLSWQLLLRPAGTAVEPPLEWLGALLEPALLAKLLPAGWVPPLPRQQLTPLLARLPQSLAALLLPPDPVLQRCWSLTPLSPERLLGLQTLWDAAQFP